MADSNGNGNGGGMWLNAYRSLLGLAVIIIMGMMSYFGNAALSKLDAVDKGLTIQTVRLDSIEGRLTDAEVDLRSHDLRINDNASRIRVLESTN